MLLLAMVMLCCAVVAATLALFEPVSGQTSDPRVATRGPIDAAIETPVRIVGAPFVPNVKPRER
ncbi:hypothetical protein [Bradyrhizobium neotropicale]|uniref:Uncharacterized protein n=1 Tax=Bradyrhizobium neotropicale TaxID=1497615 RepID=A0A176ZJV1_9BRAD|nr:hypothetical protein [Bradyrhizobium neotropicale]OAF20162.1 hypothetical protein AXW67_33650 [Bradyrhizobium neotropicale]